MNNSILTEAFKKLDILEEEDFNLGSSSEIEDAKDFIDNDELEDTLDIIDIQAEDEEGLSDSYIGKAVLECVVCHSNIFEDADKITIDEENQVANIEDECPYCFSTDGFKVIGQIAPFGEVKEQIEVEEEELPEEDIDIDVDMDEIDESIKPGNKRKLKESVENKLEINKVYTMPYDETIKVKFIGTKEEDGQTIFLMKPMTPEAEEISAEHMSDMGMDFNGIDEWTQEEVEYSLFDEVDESLNECGDMKSDEYTDNEALEEDFKDVSITTDVSRLEMTSDDNGKVTVTTEPLDAGMDDFGIEGEGEMLAPLTDDTIEEIADAQPVEGEEEFVDDFSDEIPEEGYDDIDIDEFDEETFDNLGESYLKKVYENVNSFKTTAIKESDDKLKIEGLINFKSGSTKKTSFIFEAKDITKKGKLRFIGENKEITRGKKAFTISGRLDGSKFICESFNYNYKAKDQNGKSTRLYGTIKRK